MALVLSASAWSQTPKGADIDESKIPDWVKRQASSPLKVIVDTANARAKTDKAEAARGEAATVRITRPAARRPVAPPGTEPAVTAQSLDRTPAADPMTAGPSVPNATTVAAPAPEAPPIAAAAAPLAVGVAPVVAGMAAAPAINTSSAAAALAEPSPLLLLTRVDPTLPRELIDRLDRAEVLVTFTVNTAGQVEAPAITSSTDRRLNRNVLSALGEWRYAPPAEPRQHSVRFSFELGG